ncbi:hypothetical protein SAMN05444487_10662 [Marininema mesophilum]|uniref:Short-chain dehydrogenase n=1 Tax=Marininema mesophilum TaxID=1048340 RepID=A0A1H2WA26_9BACL|nr:SDR family oxidoreductase [Marininema mesophilum]SDW77358.1 hypothetical protein SAMN05444487_10662 [Marininema mesophilum]
MPTALITGASAGIGEAFACLLAEKKLHLVLVARREKRLQSIASEINTRGGSAEILVADLATPEGLTRVQNYILTHPIDLLINNAGFGLYGPTAETNPEKEAEMIRLNVVALTTLTRAALPSMLAKKSGQIIQVGSLASFFPTPYMTGYGATKSFVLHYSEALHREVKGSGVTITALCPGSTKSEFAELTGIRQYRPMTAVEVARQGLLASEQGKSFILPGMNNWLLTFFSRLIPRNWMVAMVARVFRDRS